ncbi:MAG: hypothetical protein JRD19_03275 [Deltaproteobacteria bacterium]|jgi:hypothetical protein|nr:hypothetical protein [Deltaproteobacteria bacterium]
MIRLFVLLLLPLLPLALTGCSDGNSSAPPDNGPHPLTYIKTHPADALAVPGFEDCVSCHAADLSGSGQAVSCYSCHSYNDTPPFIIHPADWVDPYFDHRGYASANGFTSCSNCHGADLQGSAAAPSCFTSDYNGRGCHPDGPGQAPHPVDGSYLDGTNHGPEAKADLTVCQACHGQLGGPGSNPRFNIGINSVNGTGCEACHGINYAHPADWAGPNNTFHYSASNIENACTLCHGAALDGAGGVGGSCLGCHDSTIDFTLDCVACHGYPPDGTPDVATATGVDHRAAASIFHDICVVCHGMKESDTEGSFAVAENYLLFDKGSDSIGDHWDGNIDMNASTDYDPISFGCNAACHINDAAHQLSDSGLAVELKEFGLSDTVPHPVDKSFFLPQNHGPAAKGQTAAFPDGMADCRLCHAQGDPNPRFNVGIVLAGGIGCEGCHNELTAHPSNWYDLFSRHGDIEPDKFTTMCTLCHGANLGGAADGGVGPACIACHTVDPVANSSGCVSCHNIPPDGNAPAGNVRPNSQGQHDNDGHSSLINIDPGQTCSRCHNGAGFGTAAHFDTSRPTDVKFLHPDASDTITNISTVDNTTCNGACHIGSITVDHNNATWYTTP